jgi:hypothetical protein
MAADSYAQLLMETTPNSEFNSSALSTAAFYVPATEIDWHLPGTYDDRSDELRGVPEGLPPDVTGFDVTDFTFHMRLYPNVMGFFLSMCLGAGTFTAGNGVITDPDAVVIPVGASRWVWDSSIAGAQVRSAQVTFGYKDNSAGAADTFFRSKGVTVDGVSFGSDPSQNPFQVTAKGLYTTRLGSDPGLTPAYDAPTIKPFYSYNHQVVTWLAGQTLQTGMTYQLANPVDPYDAMDTSLYPAGWDRSGIGLALTGSMDTRYLTASDFDAFLAGTQFTVKTRFKSAFNIGATSYKYAMWIEGNAMYNDFQAEAMKHQVKHGQTVPFVFGRSAAGGAFKITIVNAVTSYSSVG